MKGLFPALEAEERIAAEKAVRLALAAAFSIALLGKHGVPARRESVGRRSRGAG